MGIHNVLSASFILRNVVREMSVSRELPGQPGKPQTKINCRVLC